MVKLGIFVESPAEQDRELCRHQVKGGRTTEGTETRRGKGQPFGMLTTGEAAVIEAYSRVPAQRDH